MFWLVISIMFLLMQLNILTIFNVITRMNLFENNINREIFNGPRRQIDSREQREKKNEYLANKYSNKPPQKFKYISNEKKYNYDDEEEVNSEEEQYYYENNN